MKFGRKNIIHHRHSLALQISPWSVKGHGCGSPKFKFWMCSYPAGFATTRWCLRFLVIRPHRTHSVHKMRPIATDGVAWSVCLCLLVVFVSLKERLNRSRCRLEVRLGWAKEPCCQPYCGWDPHGKGRFAELSGPLKSIGRNGWGNLCSKKSITAIAEMRPAGCNAPDWSVSHYILPVKNPPPRCGLSSDHLLVGLLLLLFCCCCHRSATQGCKKSEQY